MASLVYENPDGEDIIFKEGPVYLNSENLVKVFSFPLFSSGEEYRAKTITIIASDLINKNVASGFSDNIDDYFSIVINSEIETDITSYDYDEYSEAIKYTASNPDSIVKYVFVSGGYDDYGRFVLDENFIRSLTEW